MFTTKLLGKATNIFFIFELGWPLVTKGLSDSELSDNIFPKIYFHACLAIHCILTSTIDIIRMYFGNDLILNYRITHEIDLRHKFQWSWNNLLTLSTTALGHLCSDRARWLVSVNSTPSDPLPIFESDFQRANQVKTTVKIAKMSFKSALTRLSTVGARGMLTQRFVLFVWTWPISITFLIPYFSLGYFLAFISLLIRFSVE